MQTFSFNFNEAGTIKITVEAGCANLESTLTREPSDSIYNASLDGLESLLLALAADGHDIETMRPAIETAVEAIAHNTPEVDTSRYLYCCFLVEEGNDNSKHTGTTHDESLAIEWAIQGSKQHPGETVLIKRVNDDDYQPYGWDWVTFRMLCDVHSSYLNGVKVGK